MKQTNRRIFYKALRKNGFSPYAHYQWPLPEKKNGEWIPGKWVTITGKIVPCHWGLHAINFMYNGYLSFFEPKIDYLYIIQFKGPVYEHSWNKVIGSKARLLRRVSMQKLTQNESGIRKCDALRHHVSGWEHK